jgi:hypothetical protein
MLLVGCLQVAQAQNTIESIRKAYQDQKAVIAEMCEEFPYEGYPPCYYHLSVAMNLPATGLHRENIRMYFDEVEQDNEEDYNPYPPHYLTFLTTKYNYAAREFYEEYLFDEKGQVMFIYAQTPDIDMSKMHELRLYFNGKNLLRLNVKACQDGMDSEKLKASDFKDVYTGTTIPEAYQQACEMYQAKASQYLGMFKSIDNVVY